MVSPLFSGKLNSEDYLVNNAEDEYNFGNYYENIIYETDDDENGNIKNSINVINKSNDESRGFRLFDGALFSIKDVSSEELFLERMKIAYGAYETYVEPNLVKSPVQITKSILTALGASIVYYFSRKSLNNDGKPIINEIIHLNSPLMFCTNSDFCKSYLYVKTENKDYNILNKAFQIFGNGSSSSDDNLNNYSNSTKNNGIVSDDDVYNALPKEWQKCSELWTESSKILSFLNNNNNEAFNEDDLLDEEYYNMNDESVGLNNNNNNLNENNNYYFRRNKLLKRDINAILFLLCDFDTLHNYITFIMYMTPEDLRKRYNVQFECLKKFNFYNGDESNEFLNNIANACCVERSKKKNVDLTKNALSSFILKKSYEKTINENKYNGNSNLSADNMFIQESESIRINDIVHRNGQLLKNLLLMLFDKNISYLLDNGFDNLNRKRKYSTGSSKEIGSSTIFTGIIDTVGQVATRFVESSFIIGGGGGDGSADEELLNTNDGDKPKQIRIVLPVINIPTG